MQEKVIQKSPLKNITLITSFLENGGSLTITFFHVSSNYPKLHFIKN